ncbi:MAG: MATE family efflux transporter [Oscillospiraceae bacterium]|nr:MATE family efflux transporter [Oscillospiraceae bacterium]
MSEKETVVQNPLGTEPIGRLVLKFAIPATISLVVNALYNIVDQIFIGNSVGYLGNAATNVIYPLTVIMLAVASLWGDGCAAYISLQLGKGNKARASAGACNMLAMSIAMSLVIMVVSLVFLNPLCNLFGATENSLSYALEYGFIIALGFPCVAILVPLTATIRADGNPTYAMIGLFIGCGTNLILDPVFIFVCGWGVRGAALATILGELFNAICVLLYIPKFKNITIRKEFFRLRGNILKRVAGLGVSSFILQLSFALIVTVSNNVLSIFGAASKYGADIPVATMGITMKVNQIAVNVVQGIVTGTQPIMGYNYGAQKYARTKAAFKLAVAASTIFLIFATFIFQVFPMSIISLFGSESDLYNEFAVKCLRYFLLCCVLNGLQGCTSIFFQSVGRPIQASINTFTKQIILAPLCIIIMAYIMGVEGALWAGAVSDGLAFLVSVFLLKRNWGKVFPAQT